MRRKVIHVYLFVFSAIFAGPRFCEIHPDILLPWQRDVTENRSESHGSRTY